MVTTRRTQSADRQRNNPDPENNNSHPVPVEHVADDMAPPAAKPVSLPAFQAKDVEFWFDQVEAIFRIGNVTNDQVQYDYVVASLDLAAAADVREILRNPPDANLYASLKAALTARHALTESARIKRVLSNEQMGDRTPSQHLRHLQNVAGDAFSESVIINLWMQALPAEVKLIVAGDTEDLPADKLAAMADRIMDVAGTRRTVASVGPPGSSAPIGNPDIAALAQQISALAKRFDTHLSRSRTAGATNAKRPRDKSPHPNSGRTDKQPDGLCWYHRRFREKATKCTPPCSWTGTKQSGNDQNQS